MRYNSRYSHHILVLSPILTYFYPIQCHIAPMYSMSLSADRSLAFQLFHSCYVNRLCVKCFVIKILSPLAIFSEESSCFNFVCRIFKENILICRLCCWLTNQAEIVLNEILLSEYFVLSFAIIQIIPALKNEWVAVVTAKQVSIICEQGHT